MVGRGSFEPRVFQATLSSDSYALGFEPLVWSRRPLILNQRETPVWVDRNAGQCPKRDPELGWWWGGVPLGVGGVNSEHPGGVDRCVNPAPEADTRQINWTGRKRPKAVGTPERLTPTVYFLRIVIFAIV